MELAARIVSAYLSKNAVPVGDLPPLIRSTYASLSGLDALAWRPAAHSRYPGATSEKPGAARIRRSVRPDGLVSFVDGKTYKTLKRHLTAHGLHPQSYRERYGLPADYPMVAHNYAEQRSQIAKSIGLGRVERPCGPAKVDRSLLASQARRHSSDVSSNCVTPQGLRYAR